MGGWPECSEQAHGQLRALKNAIEACEVHRARARVSALRLNTQASRHLDTLNIKPITFDCDTALEG
jgi:hypothetical protein